MSTVETSSSLMTSAVYGGLFTSRTGGRTCFLSSDSVVLCDVTSRHRGTAGRDGGEKWGGRYRVGVCSEQCVADEHIHTSTHPRSIKHTRQTDRWKQQKGMQLDRQTDIPVCTTVWLDHERLSCQMCFHFPLPILLDCGNVSTSHEPSTKSSHKILFFSFCHPPVKRSSVSPMGGEKREAFPYRHVLTRWAFTEYLPPNLSPPLVQAEVGAHYSARDSCKFAECSVREPSGRGLLGVRGRPWCLTLGPF